MSLTAGHTAQEYDQRKRRQGAFREDRYHRNTEGRIVRDVDRGRKTGTSLPVRLILA